MSDEFQEFVLPSFDDSVDSEAEGSPRLRAEATPVAKTEQALPEHLEKSEAFETIHFHEGYDAGAEAFASDADYGQLDTGEYSKSEEEKLALASEFESDKFNRENSLLTDAEAYARSIREGAELYKRQLLSKTEDAHAEAEQLKRETQALKQAMEDERQDVLQNAYTEAEQIKEQGYQEGFEAGRQEGMQQRFQESEYLAHQMSAVIEQLASLRQVVRFQAEQELVQLSVLIAKRVIIQELELNPEMLQNILRKALKEIETMGRIQVFLHPEDFEFIQNTGVDLEQYMDEDQTLSIKVNPDAEPGSIYIETDDNALNFTLQQQFEQVEEELSQKLAQRQVQLHTVDMDAHDFSPGAPRPEPVEMDSAPESDPSPQDKEPAVDEMIDPLDLLNGDH
jgi:flagellar assembly protein FliH